MKKKILLALIVPSIMIILIFIYQILFTDLKFFDLPKWFKYALSIYIVYSVKICYRDMESNIKWLFILPLLITYVLIIKPFSPIDEAAHLDYIYYIFNSKKLPIMGELLNASFLTGIGKIYIPQFQNHEFFQPPFYYLITSVLFYIFKNKMVAFYGIRIIGTIALICVYYIAIKCYKLLKKYEIIKKDDDLFYYLILLFMFSSGFLVRMVTVSNEHFSVLLSAIGYYYILKYILENENLSFKNSMLISLVLVLAILTKVTTFYFFIIFLILIIIKKDYKSGLVLGFISTILIIPWVVFNYYNYGSLTAVKQHLSIVIPIVNPNGIKLGLDYLIDTISQLFTLYWMPQEVIVDSFLLMILNFVAISLLIIIFMKVIDIFNPKRIKKEILLEKKSLIFIVSLASIMSNYCMLAAGTLSTGVSVIVGRYMYINVIPILIIVYDSISRIEFIKFRKIVIFISIFVFVSTNIYSVTSFLEPLNLHELRYEYIYNDKLNISLENVTSKNIDNLDTNEYNYASGNQDPQIYNILKDDIKNDSVLLALKIKSNVSGYFQIFFKDQDNGFSEILSEKIYIDDNNIIIIKFPNALKNISDIRIDPPDNSKFKIETLQLIKIK